MSRHFTIGLMVLVAFSGFARAQTVGDRVYVTGGTDGADEQNLCISFAVDGQGGVGEWRDHAPMLAGRSGHGMVLLEDCLYVVGGGWEEPFRYNERYDVANDAWSTFNSPLVGEWRNLGLAAVDTKKGGLVVALGGWSGGYLGVVQAYQAVFRVFLPS